MTQKMIASNTVANSIKQRSLYECLTSIITLEPLRSTKVKIAVLRLSGIIGKSGGLRSKGLSIEDLNSQIEQAFNFPKVTAVCLIINSPGGSPVQSELIANRIISLSKEKKVPVYSFVEDVAASGGYWLACSGSEIYASKASIIGSIGVISSGFGLQEAIQKIGVERRVYTAGKNKSVLDPFLPTKVEDVKLLKKLQTHVHKHFIDYVKNRRGGKLTQDEDILFNGEFWSGDIALDYGLIDGIDDFYSFIKRKFGDKAKIEYMSVKESWFKKKIGIFTEKLASEISSEFKNSLNEAAISSKYHLE